MRIAVCDDDIAFLSNFKQYLIKNWHLEEDGVQVFRTGEELLNACMDTRGIYDVVFLDIELEGADGVEIGEKLRETDEETLLIFLTNYEKYALKGYRARAFRYMLKPVSDSMMQTLLQDIQREQRRKQVLQIETEGGNVFLQLPKIKYIESHEKYTTVFGDGRRYLTRKSLNDYEAQLADKGFYRIHRKYIINLYRIDRFRNYQVKLEDKWLPVGRRRWKDFKKALYCFLEKGIIND